MHVVVTASPLSIHLRWEPFVYANSITISRWVPPDTAWVTLGSVAATATSYTDTNLSLGTLFEYRIQKMPSAHVSGVTYVTAGMDVPFDEQPRGVLILVDNAHRTALASQLSRLATDMEEGWWVQTEGVSATASPFVTAPTVVADREAYLRELESDDGYAFTFAIGGGSAQSVQGGPGTLDFVIRKPKAVFMGLFGSYFGDWGSDAGFSVVSRNGVGFHVDSPALCPSAVSGGFLPVWALLLVCSAHRRRRC
ncbi:MAG: fibronectin type III domain-containing protein [Cystobacterineae bacterium]|nr:fibronectin type III domain-containing protein [Cystobacterineae bacterium]